MSKLRTIKFVTQPDFELFRDNAEWRHPNDRMDADESRRTIAFTGDVDPQLESLGRRLGGEWE